MKINIKFLLIIGISILVCFSGTLNVFAGQEEVPFEIPFTAEIPVVMTNPGQTPEIAIVSLLARKINLEIKTEYFLEPKALEGMKTLIIIIGGSGKGLGTAGVDIQYEVKRANELIATCKEKGIKIIGMHLGGKERLGENSQVMIDLVTPECDYVVVRKDGNEDGIFTRICEENKIPLTEIEQTIKVMDVLGALFQVEGYEPPCEATDPMSD